MPTRVVDRPLYADESKRRPLRWNLGSALVLFTVIAAIYSNSLSAIWTLDDVPNILQNQRIQIEDLRMESIFRSFFLSPALEQGEDPGVSRPVAQLSFALNWFMGKDSPIGYRVVNITIHFITAFLLFLSVRGLLRTPAMGDELHRPESIALLSALIWAVNPIQSQAVVYIVQRMASLACLFYLLAMWCYVRGRLALSGRRWRWFVATGISFALAVGSKENALMLPAALVLLEVTFFQGRAAAPVPRRLKLLAGGLIVLLLAAAGWQWSSGKLTAYLDYSSRLFTLTERLLTQPRILLFYLSQIAYPVPNRLSIEHDVEISQSLIDPWTTLPSIIIVTATIAFALFQVRRRPMASFAILFFFLNHAIESSVIPLELIFEHRNYLPSLFIFVPVATGLLKAVEYCRRLQPSVRYVATAFPILLVAGLGAGTYARNMAWQDARTFWEDAAVKAPLSMRPLHNLAYEHYERVGDAYAALHLYQKELGLRGYNRRDISTAHVNIANHHFRIGDYGAAIHHLETALRHYPDFELVQYRLALVLAQAGYPERAIATLNSLLAKRPGVVDYSFLAGQICVKNGMFAEGLDYLRNCLRRSSAATRPLFMTGVALSLSGHPERAEWFFKLALARQPNDQRLLLWMVDCKLKQSDETGAREYAEKLIQVLSPRHFQADVVRDLSDGFMPEISIQEMALWMREHLEVSGLGAGNGPG
jgi:protein O-mannosyl-transferase